MKSSVKSALVAVFLNIVLSVGISPFATSQQIKPPNGAENLDYFSQIIHMLVHHKQVLLISSLIIFVIVFLAVEISQRF